MPTFFCFAFRFFIPCAPPSNAGNPAGAANRGRLFFGYFILAKQKKVACCRATPDGVDFGVGHSPFDKLRANGVKSRATPTWWA